MKQVRIRLLTISRLFELAELALAANRMLTVQEVIQYLHCCKTTAYNYLKALKRLLQMFG